MATETRPTMERPTKEGKETEEEEELQKQYRNLQKGWYFIKRSNPRSLTDSRTIVKGIHLLENSPRKLMSSLQYRRRSPAGLWKVRNNDLAVEEILRERKAAIESGKLKGRRLFDLPAESSGWIQEIICGDDLGELVHESSEVRSVYSYDSDDEKENIFESKKELLLYPCNCSPSSASLSSTSASSYICDEYMEKEIVADEAATTAVAVEPSDNGEKKRFKGWLAIGLILLSCGIGIFLGWRSVITTDYSRDGNMVILVPT